MENRRQPTSKNPKGKKFTILLFAVTVPTVASVLAGVILYHLGYLGPPRGPGPEPPEPEPPGPPPPPIVTLATDVKFVTQKVVVEDVLEAKGRTHSGRFRIKGDALISVDLAKASYAKVDRAKQTATIELPQPRLIQARVDHEQSHEWSVNRTTWVPFVGDESLIRKEAMRQAQRLVKAAASSNKQAFADARSRTAQAIKDHCAKLGWDVTVSWAETD